jgi:hypothetical protein
MAGNVQRTPCWRRIPTAEAFKAILDRAGARALAVKVNVDRPPIAAEIKPVLADRGVAYLQLSD